MKLKIEKGILYGCADCEERVTVPKGVTHIFSNAFKNEKMLKSVTLPEGLVKLGSQSFEGCSSLEEINFPESLDFVGDDSFSGCASLRNVHIPARLDFIGDRAFSRCSSLEEVTIESVQSIDRYAFKHCTSLKRFSVKSGLKKIWHEAFGGCRALELVSFPASLSEMGEEVFSYYVRVTDNDEYDCYNGNESFCVPAIAYPKKLSAVGLGELNRPSALCRGFLTCPELYPVSVGKDYLSYIFSVAQSFEESLGAVTLCAARTILDRFSPTKIARVIWAELAAQSGNTALAELLLS